MFKNGLDINTIAKALSLKEPQIEKFIKYDRQPLRIKFLQLKEYKHQRSVIMWRDSVEQYSPDDLVYPVGAPFDADLDPSFKQKKSDIEMRICAKQAVEGMGAYLQNKIYYTFSDSFKE